MSLKVVFLGMAVAWCPDLGAFCPLGAAVPTMELSCLSGLVQVGGVLLVHGKMQYEQLVRGEPVPFFLWFYGAHPPGHGPGVWSLATQLYLGDFPRDSDLPAWKRVPAGNGPHPASLLMLSVLP